MSENTNCPSCHASITYEKGSYRRWCCGSWDDGHTGYQTDTCQLRHTDRQFAQAEALNKVAQRLCKIYFDIAAKAIGEEKVRELRDAAINAELAKENRDER